MINVFSFQLFTPENFGETFKQVNIIRAEISFWFFNLLIGLIVFLDMKKLKLNNIGLIILTLLNGFAGALLFLFQAYYELTKANRHE